MYRLRTVRKDIFYPETTSASRPGSNLQKITGRSQLIMWPVRVTGFSQTKKCPLDVLLCTVQRAFFESGSTHSSQLSTKSWDGLLRNDREKDN